MKRFVASSILAGLCAFGAVARAAGSDGLSKLVDTERKFAAVSLASSTKDAFLAYCDDQSVLFTPYAAPARPYFEKKPKSEILLTWDPSFAVIAASGDLGYTTGPWEIRKKRSMEEAPAAFGHFVTVWRLNADGEWRVAVDLGIAHRKPDLPDAPWTAHAYATAPRGIAAPSAQSKDALDKADKVFSDALVAGGPGSAYAPALSNDARIYRDDEIPAVGRSAALVALASEPRSTAWKTEGGGVSGAGDLGYTYGRGSRVGKGGTAEPVTYLRIWRTEGGLWKLALEVVNVVPPEAPAA